MPEPRLFTAEEYSGPPLERDHEGVALARGRREKEAGERSEHAKPSLVFVNPLTGTLEHAPKAGVKWEVLS